jgi:hypothetical protein
MDQEDTPMKRLLAFVIVAAVVVLLIWWPTIGVPVVLDLGETDIDALELGAIGIAALALWAHW